MKRITMIVAIALLVVLSARFDSESQTYQGPATVSYTHLTLPTILRV